jgi:hypothetical protein
MGLTDGVRFSLHEFAEVFTVRNSDGLPYVLIGGQAVNYWAERYLSIEPELHRLLPFTSEDIDFQGERQDVKRIAEQLRLIPQYPHIVEMTSLAGFIQFQVGDLKSTIEVVRRIPGVLGSVETLAVEAERAGKKIRVLDPISLLSCKLELATTVSQDKRRDVEHLRILVPCVRAFLREFLERIERGELPARGWLGAANRVMKLTGLPRARKAAKQHGINWRQILPLHDIVASKNEKLIQFGGEQLFRWKMK